MKLLTGIANLLRPFFFSGDKFQPIYFWATVFLSLVVAMLVMAICNKLPVDKEILITVIGLVTVLIGLYNWGKKGGGNDGMGQQ